MNITIVGHVDIDKNESENSSYIAAGSPAIFMDKIFKQLLDCKVKIIASYGEDFLRVYKTESLYNLSQKMSKTLVYENITKNNMRTQKVFNEIYAYPVEINSQIEEILGETEILFISPILPNFSTNYIESLIKKIPKNALKVLLPQGYFRTINKKNMVEKRMFKEANEILPLFDLMILSEADYPNIENLSKDWSKKYNIITAITKGEKGVTILDNKKILNIPTEIVLEKDIIDSVGSGDIFSAGFAYSFYKTKSFKKAGVFANALARQCLFFTANDIKINYPSLPK